LPLRLKKANSHSINDTKLRAGSASVQQGIM